MFKSHEKKRKKPTYLATIETESTLTVKSWNKAFQFAQDFFPVGICVFVGVLSLNLAVVLLQGHVVELCFTKPASGFPERLVDYGIVFAILKDPYYLGTWLEEVSSYLCVEWNYSW